jgi:hypothetical protein
MTVGYFADATTGSDMIGIGFAVASTPDPGSAGLPTSIATDDLFFWTRLWRDGESESAAARKAGDVREFASGRDAVRWLLSDD